MPEPYVRCKCGMSKKYHEKDSGGEPPPGARPSTSTSILGETPPSLWLCDCERFTVMVCAKCGKEINRMTLCKYDINRDYYCVEHCPKHEWQSDFDWPTECMHCGLLEKDFLRSEVVRLEAELKAVKGVIRDGPV